jgi:NAD(P)H-flavin reductase
VAGDLLLMAGGLGLAPLRGAFLRALRATDRIRRVVLLYGTREPRTILFAEELRRWAGETRADVRVTVDAAAPGWTGNVGLITSLLGRDLVDAARTTALVCGPEVMMRFAARHLGTLGVPMSRVHVSLERHMACGTAQCGRCQLGPLLLCRDGPVVPYADVARELSIAEL